MRIEYLFFILYMILIFWAIPKIAFISHTQLQNREIKFLLVFKILASIVCAYYFVRTNADYLRLNFQGLLQYNLLLSNPRLFFTDFSSDINAYGLGRLFETQDSFWGYLRFNLLFKLIAILNLVTKGNFYFNTVIFSSIVFFGHIAFYRIYNEIYPGNKRKILAVAFCLPSVLLYTSCVHKDGIIFLSIAIISYIFHRYLSSSRSVGIKYLLALLIATLSIFLFRNYIVVAIVPAMLTALLCKMLIYKKRYIILLAYSFFFLVFFVSGFSDSTVNLPAAVVQRKADFSALAVGNTNIKMTALYPTPQSFITNLPQAINHYLFRPYLWEFPQLSVLLTAIELFVYQLLILAFIFYRKKSTAPVHTFNIFGLLFVFNMMLIIGYTIPNVGAIVRYRSIFWVFIICPVICNIDWQRLAAFRKGTAANNKNNLLIS